MNYDEKRELTAVLGYGALEDALPRALSHGTYDTAFVGGPLAVIWRAVRHLAREVYDIKYGDQQAREERAE